MNNDYHILRLEEAKTYQQAQLLEMYNDAVETIWELQRIKQELKKEIDLWQKAYAEVSNKLYGWNNSAF